MAYKIAVGSSDGIHVDLKFGEVTRFLIYEITDKIRLAEERIVCNDMENPGIHINPYGTSDCRMKGCGGNGSGCSGPADVLSKVSLISDCRCVVCKKIGFQAQKQLERKAISVFDVECEINEALEKIVRYYERSVKRLDRLRARTQGSPGI